MKPSARTSGLFNWLQAALAAVADFDQVRKSQVTIKTRDQLERMVMLATATELIGVPMAPPELSLRLLPYFVPKVYQWRRAAQGLNDFSGEIKGPC